MKLDLRSYLAEAYSNKKNIIHFCLILIVALALSLAAYFLSYKHLNSNRAIINFKQPLGNAFLIAGMWCLCYSLIIVIFKKGFGFSFNRFHQNKKEDKLKNQILNEKHKAQSFEQRAKVRLLEKQLKDYQDKNEFLKITKANNAIYYVSIIIGVVLVLISLIPYFT